MKKPVQSLVAILAAVVVTGGISLAYNKANLPRIADSEATVADTLVINTTAMGKDIEGFKGATPLEIKVAGGKVVAIKALPNKETPGYFRMVQESDIFTKPIGLSVNDVLKLDLDAVSGATYSSKAVIKNLRLGLAAAAEKEK